MIKCQVLIYDDSMRPLRKRGIEIICLDSNGVMRDIQWNERMGEQLYGTQLSTPSEAIMVWIDDRDDRFAPSALGYLNGAIPGRLDVALYPLPAPPRRGEGGDLISAPDQVADLVLEHYRSGRWTRAEGIGVLGLYETAVRARALPERDRDFHHKVERWAKLLDDRFGITIAAERARQAQAAT